MCYPGSIFVQLSQFPNFMMLTNVVVGYEILLLKRQIFLSQVNKLCDNYRVMTRHRQLPKAYTHKRVVYL